MTYYFFKYFQKLPNLEDRHMMSMDCSNLFCSNFPSWWFMLQIKLTRAQNWLSPKVNILNIYHPSLQILINRHILQLTFSNNKYLKIYQYVHLRKLHKLALVKKKNQDQYFVENLYGIITRKRMNIKISHITLAPEWILIRIFISMNYEKFILLYHDWVIMDSWKTFKQITGWGNQNILE